ncbi:biotin transport system substrate-specific component [Streptomyces zhaozhouensis]|uniref:Biotin transporter n=1 Tax=Streptomyces zhaozhouensis TaxID=1300267 RepID=A0A286E600_9ACTN|nr:biotin transporter BioY [Streptomyces zhaozhouensis]SOD66332.1 biotin transport system substrate-specific component [Streptomyces zhaozhouensis]
MSSAIVAGRPRAVLADLLPATTAPATRARDLALVVGGAVFTGVAAQLSLPVPGSPVPVTGQTFAALLVGASFGPVRAMLSMTLYVLAGMAGTPWFSEGTSGYGMPSFGYLLGMTLAAVVVGALARRGGDRTVPRTVATMALGSALIYSVGVPYLALATGMSAGEAVAAGLTPFLLGDALKVALAMGALPAAWRLVGRGRGRD